MKTTLVKVMNYEFWGAILLLGVVFRVLSCLERGQLWQVMNLGPLEKLCNCDDRVLLLLNIKADLESMFTWNTKQVSIGLAMLSIVNLCSLSLRELLFAELGWVLLKGLYPLKCTCTEGAFSIVFCPLV